MHFEVRSEPASRIHRPRYSPPFFCRKFDDIECIIGAEHPSIRAYALAPGLLPTLIFAEAVPAGTGGGEGFKAVDAIALPAATMLYLTSGRADWLSGRSVHVIILHHVF